MKPSKFFLILGIFFLSLFSWELYLRNRSSRLAFASAPSQSSSINMDTPVIIKINSVGIELPVIPASFDGKNWPTTTKGASFIPESNVFYAHNWSNLFGPLAKVKPGDSIEIITKDGKTYTYTVAFTQEIEPNQTYILNQTIDSRLTLYTCIGFLDSKRFVVTAFID
ncbi:sortase [Candidatus Gottesmanbacteria bacterium]|nr:sortase [Candidatus Gottesmanbacteria bacterium]